MTKSNITKEHEGKHGVLTLGDARIPGVIGTVGSDRWMSFAIDHVTTGTEAYGLSDGWQFTPDPDPLPTEVGWYATISPGVMLYYLTAGGNWFMHTGKTATYASPVSMLNRHARDPLVRVSFGVAS